MLSKITKGKNFGGVLDYVFTKPKAKLLSQNLSSTMNRDRVQEFEQVWQKRPRVQRPVFHVSLAVNGALKLTKTQWRKLVKAYLKGMGFANCQYVAIRHNHQACDHVHVVANRVTFDGQLVSDSWDYLKSQAVLRTLEQKFSHYGLTSVPSSHQVLRTPPSLSELERDKDGLKVYLQNLVEKTARSSLNFPQFRERLERQGVKITFGSEATLMYHYQDHRFLGSHLGKGFTNYGLRRYFINQPQPTLDYQSPSWAIAPCQWLTKSEAQTLYKGYFANSEKITDIARAAKNDGWNWEAIRFILTQSFRYKDLKKRVGRRVALKYLNAAIASGTQSPGISPNIEFEGRYVMASLKAFKVPIALMAGQKTASAVSQGSAQTYLIS